VCRFVIIYWWKSKQKNTVYGFFHLWSCYLWHHKWKHLSYDQCKLVLYLLFLKAMEKQCMAYGCSNIPSENMNCFLFPIRIQICKQFGQSKCKGPDCWLDRSIWVQWFKYWTQTASGISVNRSSLKRAVNHKRKGKPSRKERDLE